MEISAQNGIAQAGKLNHSLTCHGACHPRDHNKADASIGFDGKQTSDIGHARRITPIFIRQHLSIFIFFGLDRHCLLPSLPPSILAEAFDLCSKISAE